MGEYVKKPEGDSGSASGGGAASGGNGSATATSANTNNNTAAILPQDTPPPVANATPVDQADSKISEGQSRELSVEQKKEPEKKAELSFAEKLHEVTKKFADYQLSSAMIAHAMSGDITGKVMSGLAVTLQAIDQAVQKADPVAHAMKHVRDALGPAAGTMVAVSNADNVAPMAAGQQAQINRQQSLT